jgi:hypothetical protein
MIPALCLIPDDFARLTGREKISDDAVEETGLAHPDGSVLTA